MTSVINNRSSLWRDSPNFNSERLIFWLTHSQWKTLLDVGKFQPKPSTTQPDKLIYQPDFEILAQLHSLVDKV
jgi:hypothetical protein